MLKPDKIADKIVSMVADGRMTFPLIESVGFWIVQHTIGTEAEKHMLTLAHSIIDNVKDQHGTHGY